MGIYRLLVFCIMSNAILLSALAMDGSTYNGSTSEIYLNLLANSYADLPSYSQVKSNDSYIENYNSSNYLDYLIRKEEKYAKEYYKPYYPGPSTPGNGKPFNDNAVLIEDLLLQNQEASSLTGPSQQYLFEDEINSIEHRNPDQYPEKVGKVQNYEDDTGRNLEMALVDLNSLSIEHTTGTSYDDNSHLAYSFNTSKMDSTLEYAYKKIPSIENPASGLMTASPMIQPETDNKLSIIRGDAFLSGSIENSIQTIDSDFNIETRALPNYVREGEEIQDKDYFGRSINANRDLLSTLASSTNNSPVEKIDGNNAYDTSISDINYIYQNSGATHNIEPEDTDKKFTSSIIQHFDPSIVARSDALGNIYQPIGLQLPITQGSDYFRISGEHSAVDLKKSSKNYAIIIGINSYIDRAGLHTSVNDANMIACLLEFYGYEIIKLTDETAYKPTKNNILDGALAKIKLKQNRGNVIFYFSGHGLLDNRGNFYLLPQDSNGNTSSYISEKDLRQYTKDIKNLAIIIDACNSGALCNMADDGQLIIASSKEQEPSNEEWIGSLSVFTRNLCNAIEEKGKRGAKISLQDCFSEAYYNTIDWSNKHIMFIEQTPSISDRTLTQTFYLN